MTVARSEKLLLSPGFARWKRNVATMITTMSKKPTTPSVTPNMRVRSSCVCVDEIAVAEDVTAAVEAEESVLL